jgi:small subunit ribosomal protein S3
LSTFRADIDYGFATAFTTYGTIGVKTWIYKGDVLVKKQEAQQMEERKAQAVPVSSPAPSAAPVEVKTAAETKEQTPPAS